MLAGVVGLVMPLNSSRAVVDAPIAPKIEQVVWRVLVLGVGQLPIRVAPSNTPPPP